MAEITDSVLARFSSIRFEFAEDISGFFQQRKGKHYLTWFNEALAGKGAWKDKRVLDTPANQVGFHQFWNNTPLLMAFCGLFVISYVMAYLAIVRFKVPHWLRH